MDALDSKYANNCNCHPETCTHLNYGEHKDDKKKMKKKKKQAKITEIRQAFSDYIATEGCSCCQDIDGHNEAMNRLGKLLKMKRYSDGSGYDYSKYKSN